MEMISLQASARDAKSKPNQLRQSGKVPAVVYGSMDGNMHIQCDAIALHKAFVKAGESSLVELDVDGKKVPVLFKEITLHPITDREIHVDFYAVNMKQEIEAPVPLHFEGESLAVKAEGGILVISHDTVRVRCLPSALPHSLTVSLNSLAALHDSITVNDIVLPKDVKIMEDPATVIATVQEPRQEEVATVAAEGAVAEGAAAAPGAEGAPAAEGAAKTEAEAKDKAAKDKK